MSRIAWSSSTTGTCSLTTRVAGSRHAVQLRRPPQEVQYTLNRWPEEHRQTDFPPSHRVLNRLDDSHHGRVGEIQISKVQTNIGQPAMEQVLESFYQSCLIGAVEVSPALQNRGPT
jgi:hypothetical protein